LELEVRNGSGTVVSRPYAVSYLGPLAIFGSFAGAAYSVPFFQVLSLPVGPYTIYAKTTTTQTRGWNSGGGYVAFSNVDLLNIVGAIYQAKI
jgi:hypothetical protein